MERYKRTALAEQPLTESQATFLDNLYITRHPKQDIRAKIERTLKQLIDAKLDDNSNSTYRDWAPLLTLASTVTSGKHAQERQTYYICPTCHKKFLRESSRNKHRAAKPRCKLDWELEKNTPKPCDKLTCNRSFVTMHKLKKHKAFHCHDKNMYKHLQTTLNHTLDDRRWIRNVGVPSCPTSL